MENIVKSSILLELDDAKRIIDAAIDVARDMGCAVTVSVVDAGGHLISLDRMDGAHAATPEVAIGKARCAALFRRETKVFSDAAKSDPSICHVGNMFAVPGGVPIVVDGTGIGGVGVSGAASNEDAEIARAAIESALRSHRT
ncbi:heme-binding protein [Marivibrio halodurans]|uniref:Heme-binding protein n=1 Tax=Marivibrio halodurans TaxID=2039722 RepID=A0A8J7V576_9PROT|nr:heme-binding protein [Marivibrio halodurans]